jgi:hypothetical protein
MPPQGAAISKSPSCAEGGVAVAEASAVCKPPLLAMEWWLAPIVILVLSLGLILVLTEGSAPAPFVYSLF